MFNIEEQGKSKSEQPKQGSSSRSSSQLNKKWSEKNNQLKQEENFQKHGHAQVQGYNGKYNDRNGNFLYKKNNNFDCNRCGECHGVRECPCLWKNV